MDVLGSNAAVCSSNNNILGLDITAIIRVKACLCPPDNKLTLLYSLSSKPKFNLLSSSL